MGRNKIRPCKIFTKLKVFRTFVIFCPSLLLKAGLLAVQPRGLLKDGGSETWVAIKNCITHLVNSFSSIWLEPVKFRHLPMSLVVICHYGEFVSIFISDFQTAVGFWLMSPQLLQLQSRTGPLSLCCKVCTPGPHLGSCVLCPLQFVNVFFELRALKLIPVFQQQPHHFWVLSIITDLTFLTAFLMQPSM